MNLKPILATCCLLPACLQPLLAEQIQLEDVSALRTEDLNRDGQGDIVANNYLFIGNAQMSVDYHPVFVFQMLGKTNGDGIADASFSITQQGNVGPATFKQVDLIALRTSPSIEVIASDFHSEGTIIMPYFAGANGTPVGLRVTDSRANQTLASYLNQHWHEGSYLFFTLRSTAKKPPFFDPAELNGYTYGNSSIQWGPKSCDATLSVTTSSDIAPTSSEIDDPVLLKISNLKIHTQ
ncbi:hypothetical protein [Rubritalea marina]|uniref:hypothetical protein n=1 Tax=Rubritalea marina TaxID=361055 RepID=UPI000365DF09|nr:hypothetical protein [Rubritalea marina]